DRYEKAPVQQEAIPAQNLHYSLPERQFSHRLPDGTASVAGLFLTNYPFLLSWRLPPWAACSGITLLQIKIRAAALISQNRRQQKIGVKSNLPRSGFSLFCRWQIFYIW